MKYTECSRSTNWSGVFGYPSITYPQLEFPLLWSSSYRTVLHIFVGIGSPFIIFFDTFSHISSFFSLLIFFLKISPIDSIVKPSYFWAILLPMSFFWDPGAPEIFSINWLSHSRAELTQHQYHRSIIRKTDWVSQLKRAVFWNHRWVVVGLVSGTHFVWKCINLYFIHFAMQCIISRSCKLRNSIFHSLLPFSLGRFNMGTTMELEACLSKVSNYLSCFLNQTQYSNCFLLPGVGVFSFFAESLDLAVEVALPEKHDQNSVSIIQRKPHSLSSGVWTAGVSGSFSPPAVVALEPDECWGVCATDRGSRIADVDKSWNE